MIDRRRFAVGCCILWLAAFSLSACRRDELDLRRFAPADALVYLESKNIGKTLEALSRNENFQKAAANAPDFSALEGVGLAIVITGFQSSEKPAGEQAILHFQPHFVAIAETNTWSWQTASLIENNLDAFVKKQFGAASNFAKMTKDGGAFYIWTAADERRFFAYGKNGLIYFGNDDAAIEKCLAAASGAAANLTANDALGAQRENSKDALAIGYAAPEGVAAFADYIGVAAAVGVSAEENPRAFVAAIVPPIIKKTIREVVWSAYARDGKIEDVWQIKTEAENTKIWRETLIAGADAKTDAAEFLPAEVFSATRYNLQNPQIAWRSLLLTAANRLNETQAKFLLAFSGSFFAPYNIADGEAFLSGSGGGDIWTARFDAAGDENIVIAGVKDRAAIEKTRAPEIDFRQKPVSDNAAQIYISEDRTQAAAFIADKIVLGSFENVARCLEAKRNARNFAATNYFSGFQKINAAVTTFTKNSDAANKIAAVLTDVKPDAPKIYGVSFVTTQFLTDKFERRAVSDFGLIGSIIGQFGSE